MSASEEPGCAKNMQRVRQSVGTANSEGVGRAENEAGPEFPGFRAVLSGAGVLLPIPQRTHF